MTKNLEWTLQPADPETFSGEAFIRLVGAAMSLEPVKVYFVRFEPGARTHWHAHSGEQILLATAGRCRYQVEGAGVMDLPAGASVRFAAGVRHWHGAAPDESGEHVAINLDIRDTHWLEAVTDESYRQPASPAESDT